MNREVGDRWLAALRSGDYVQGAGKLHQFELVDGGDEGEERHRFCCLGVLCDLAYRDGAVTRTRTAHVFLYGDVGEGDVLPPEVRVWAGLRENDPVVDEVPLSNWNDGSTQCDVDVEPTSFAEIADMIEAEVADL